MFTIKALSMSKVNHRYPVGIQTFSEIRKGNYLYVDKTRYVYDLAHQAPKYVCLNRPRRFGKSLLASTLKSYFLGERELFAGLQIDALEKEWVAHPVLHFDMSTAKHQDREELELELNAKLAEYEKVYGREVSDVKVNSDYRPLLYQAGYLTIKHYNPITGLYTLDIPNAEVRTGMMRSLLPAYLPQARLSDGKTTVALMYGKIYEGDVDGALKILQTFLDTVPQCDNTNYEGHYQQMLYVIFSLLGVYCDVEVHTKKGRVDMVMHTQSRLYVVELKLDRSADVAMGQIDMR